MLLAADCVPVTPLVDHVPVDSCNKYRYPCPMTFDQDLDACDLLCPLPVLKARKRLQALASGQILRVQATDPAAVIDIPHFCTEQGHELLAADTDITPQLYWIKKR